MRWVALAAASALAALVWGGTFWTALSLFLLGVGLLRQLLPTASSRAGKARPAAVAPSRDASPSPDVVELPIEDWLDLHPFAPRDQLAVAAEYLEAAAASGWTEVRIIHGRGTGYQRKQLRGLLENHPLVAGFHDAPPSQGGWGATIIRLKRVAAD